MRSLAKELQIDLREGVYMALLGPCFETPAEIRAYQRLGADAVGMSTVPETIVAVHCGLRVAGLSVITDECFPDALKPVNIAEIIETANTAEPKLTLIMKQLIERMPPAAV